MHVYEIGFVYDEEEQYHASLWEESRASAVEEQPSLRFEKPLSFYLRIALDNAPYLEVEITKGQADYLLANI